MNQPATRVQPIHFEDFDGAQFERLVFAYLARKDGNLSNGMARVAAISAAIFGVSGTMARVRANRFACNVPTAAN